MSETTSALDDIADALLKKCHDCAYTGHPDSFPYNKSGTKRIQTCPKCTEKDRLKGARHRHSKKGDSSTNKENVIPTTTGAFETSGGTAPTTRNVTWAVLILELAFLRKKVELDVVLKLDAEHPAADSKKTRPARAKLVRNAIHAESVYHFNYHDKKDRSLKDGTKADEFRYFCAQREGTQTKPKKCVESLEKQRGRGCMTRWHCKGLLSITINDQTPSEVRVHVHHDVPHLPYVDITHPTPFIDIYEDDGEQNCDSLYGSDLEIQAPSDLRKGTPSGGADTRSRAAPVPSDIMDGIDGYADDEYMFKMDGAGNAHYTEGEIEHHMSNFNYISENFLKNPKGVNLQLKRKLDQSLQLMEEFVVNAQGAERRLKRQRC